MKDNRFSLKTTLILVVFLASCAIQTTFSAVSVFLEPQSGVIPIIRAINHAKQSIKMTMYLLTDQQVIDALIASAQRGINVRVLLEKTPFETPGKPSQPSPQKGVYDELKTAGVHVKWTNPAFNLTHEKSMIIDHHTAYIMTLNQTYAAFTQNREYGIIDTDENDVAEIEHVFDNDWLDQIPRVYDKNLLWSPINARTKLLTLIGSAHLTLYIEAEEVQDWAIEALLIHQAKEGVDVRMIMPTPSSLTPDQESLIEGGVKIRFLNPLKNQYYVHAKMILADSREAYIGSENLSFYSLNYNRELGIILHQSRGYQEKHIIKILSKTFLSDWERARSQVNSEKNIEHTPIYRSPRKVILKSAASICGKMPVRP